MYRIHFRRAINFLFVCVFKYVSKMFKTFEWAHSLHTEISTKWTRAKWNLDFFLRIFDGYFSWREDKRIHCNAAKTKYMKNRNPVIVILCSLSGKLYSPLVSSWGLLDPFRPTTKMTRYFFLIHLFLVISLNISKQPPSEHALIHDRMPRSASFTTLSFNMPELTK